MNQVLAWLEAFSSAYQDDIAVFSSSLEDHLLNLREVLQVLQQADLTIKASKCQIKAGVCGVLRIPGVQGKVATPLAQIETAMAFLN